MQFYFLKSKPGRVSGETEFSKHGSVNRGPAPVCDECGGYIGLLTWLPPFCVELETWDSVFGDIALDAVQTILVSERFQTLWRERALSGLLGFEPVEIAKIKRHKRGRPALETQPPYYFVTACRSQAAIDAAGSGLVRRDAQVCPACRLGRDTGMIDRVQRIAIEPGTWKGEDVFIARGLPGTLITTERFKDFCDDNRITGVALTPAEDYHVDYTR